MLFKEKVIVVRGSDKLIVLRLVDKNTKNPIDLTNVNTIQVIFKNSDRTDFIMRNMVMPPARAKLTVGSGVFTATTPGNAGNSIILIFDGIKTVSQVISAWNFDHPTNQVTFSGKPSEILPESIISLVNGNNSYQQIEKWGNPAFGQIVLRMTEKDTLGLKTGPNQGIKVVLDGATSAIRTVGYFDNVLEVVGYV